MTDSRRARDPQLFDFAAPGAPPPPSEVPRRVPHTEDRFGAVLRDDYRWMESPESEEASAWLAAEGDSCREYLEAIPGYLVLRERVRDLGMAQSFVTQLKCAGGRAFYLKTEKGEELRKLYVRDGASERVLIDTTSMQSAEGAHISIDQHTPSDDGRWTAYALAEGGGEITSVRVMEVATGKTLPDVIDRIWGEFPVAWSADGSGFYYTQMADDAETRPDPLTGMRVRYHHLGEPPASDRVVLGEGAPGPTFESQEFPELSTHGDSPWVLGMGTGARREARLFVARAAALASSDGSPWTEIAGYADLIEDWALRGDDLYLMTSKDAPNRRVLRLSLHAPRLADAVVVAPESDEVIEEIACDAQALFVHKSRAGRSALVRLPFGGGPGRDIALPWTGWISELVTTPGQEGIIVRLEGWTHEDRYLHLAVESGRLSDLMLAERAELDYDAIVVETLEVESSDDVRVPLTVLRHRDVPRDGKSPTVLFGYGFYGAAMTPSFSAIQLAWLERGGIYATAHVRGGGEKGDAWRQGGKGANKPNSVCDFIACAEHLIAHGYTSPRRLAVFSGSAGGILIGRAVTQRPDLFVAMAVSNGILNAVRYLHSSNGANQMSELGTPDDEAGLRALLAMDAFHNVQPGVAYPATLLTMGLNDARVSPWMTAKFAAQLRASGPTRVRIRFEGDEGHGMGSLRRQRFDHYADIWAFFLESMQRAS